MAERSCIVSCPYEKKKRPQTECEEPKGNRGKLLRADKGRSASSREAGFNQTVGKKRRKVGVCRGVGRSSRTGDWGEPKIVLGSEKEGKGGVYRRQKGKDEGGGRATSADIRSEKNT